MQRPANNLLQTIIIDEFKILQEQSSNTGSLDYFKNNPDALTTNNTPVSDTFSDMAVYNKKMALSKYEPKGNWYDTPEGIANHILRASAKYRSSVKTFGAVTEFDDYEADVVDAFSRIPDYATMSRVNDIIIEKSGKNFVNFLNGFMSGPEFVNKMGGMSIVDSIQRIYGDKAYTSVIQYLKKPNDFEFKDYLKKGFDTYSKAAEYRAKQHGIAGESLVGMATEWYTTHNTWDKFINAEDGIRDMVYTPTGIVISAVLSAIPYTKVPMATVFAILAADDVYRIYKNRDVPEVYLDLIMDLVGVFVGGLGKTITKGAFAVLRPVLKLLFPAGKYTAAAVLKMVNLLKKASKPVLTLLQKMLTSVETIFSSIKSGLASIISKLKTVANEYPILKSFINGLISSTKRVISVFNKGWDIIKLVLGKLLQLIKFVLTPGKQVSKLLEYFGIIEGEVAKDVVRSGVGATAVVLTAPEILKAVPEIMQIFQPTQTQQYIVEEMFERGDVVMDDQTLLQHGASGESLKSGEKIYALQKTVKSINFYYTTDETDNRILEPIAPSLFEVTFSKHAEQPYADYDLIGLEINKDPNATKTMPEWFDDIIWLANESVLDEASIVLPD